MQPHGAGSAGAAGRCRPTVGWLVTAVVVAVVCVAVVAVRAAAGHTGPSAAPDDDLGAADVLSMWNAALTATPHPLIILGYGSDTQVGQWEPENGDYKQALLSRLVIVAPDIAAARPGSTHGTVTFGVGARRTVPVLGPQDTARLLIADSGSPQACAGCTPVRITDPRPTTAAVQTATGPATVPAWSYGVTGSKVRLVQSSIDPAEVLTTVPGLPYGLGNGETTVHVEPDGRLTVRWVGAPSVAAAGGCGTDYRLAFVEGARAVVLQFVELQSTATDTPDGCPAVAMSRVSTVAPPHALGDRVLVMDRSGFVVPRV